RRPKPSRRHAYWRAAFFVVGFGGIALTGWLTKHASDAQAAATREIHEAQTASTSAQNAATNANTAATNANNAATQAQQETKDARAEARIAQQKLEQLINQRSKETNTTITKWQSNTESAVGKLLRPARVLTIDQRDTLVKALNRTASTEIAIRHTEGCDECQQYADQLAEAVKASGWAVQVR